MGFPSWVTLEQVATWIFILCLVSSFTFALIKAVNPIIRRIMIMTDAFLGKNGIPGIPDQQGVMQRLESIDGRHGAIDEINDTLNTISDKLDKADRDHGLILRRILEIEERQNGDYD